jgi:hypothetical protein
VDEQEYRLAATARKRRFFIKMDLGIGLFQINNEIQP